MHGFYGEIELRRSIALRSVRKDEDIAGRYEMAFRVVVIATALHLFIPNDSQFPHIFSVMVLSNAIDTPLALTHMLRHEDYILA